MAPKRNPLALGTTTAMTAVTAALLLLAAAATDPTIGLASSAPAAAPFEQLVGEWSGEGTLLGRPARFDMAWSAGAAPGVYRLSFSNGFVDPAAPPGSVPQPLMSAEALYRHSGGVVEGTWFDTRGVRIELKGETTPNELRIVWTAPTETGVTRYRMVADGVEVIDSVQSADGWREFGTAHYTRR